MMGFFKNQSFWRYLNRLPERFAVLFHLQTLMTGHDLLRMYIPKIQYDTNLIGGMPLNTSNSGEKIINLNLQFLLRYTYISPRFLSYPAIFSAKNWRSPAPHTWTPPCRRPGPCESNYNPGAKSQVVQVSTWVSPVKRIGWCLKWIVRLNVI